MKTVVETPITIGMCGRDSANTLQDSKRFPYVKDCIRMGMQRASDGDIIELTRPNIKIKRAESTPAPSFAYRLEETADGPQYRPIIDLFCATRAQWKAMLPEIPDLLLSSDYQWSQCLWAIFVKHGAKDATGMATRAASPPKPFTFSKTLTHNTKLCADYMAKSGIYSRYPKASEQLECLPLELDWLKPFGYNPAIIQNSKQLWMAYRFHSGNLSTALAGAVIDDTGAVLAAVDLPTHGGGNAEDPKYFMHSGKLCMSWVESNYPKMPMRSVVRWEQAKMLTQDPLPGNDGSTMQKNWVYFERNGILYCIYQCHPTQKIYEIFSGQCLESEAPRWPYGEIRGGTPPVEYEGKLLRFFHSRITNDIGPVKWRYFVGAYLMNPEPPFAVVRVSVKPVLYGSESDNLTKAQRKECFHRKPNVVFPGGVVERDGHWLLSVGINDCQCAILKVKPENLNL